MNVFISGLNGFLASHLARHLSNQGHSVRGTTSTSTREDAYAWKLGEQPDANWLRGVDVLIHCAHDFKGTVDVNVKGTLALAAAGRAAGVSKQVFVSSLSAREDAAADYGRIKHALEQQLAGADLIIVRPGTIVGRGGLFGRMAELVRKLPVVPLIGGGNEKMYLVSVRDVCRALSTILTRSAPAEFNLYYEETPSLRAVLRAISRTLGKRRVFVPVPAGLLLFALTVANAVGIRPGVDRNNLRGFQKSQRQLHASNLVSVLPDPESVDQAIHSIAI